MTAMNRREAPAPTNKRNRWRVWGPGDDFQDWPSENKAYEFVRLLTTTGTAASVYVWENGRSRSTLSAMPDGGSLAARFASHVRAECLSSIQRTFPTWDIQGTGKGNAVTAKRGDHDVAAAGVQDLCVKLRVIEQLDRSEQGKSRNLT